MKPSLKNKLSADKIEEANRLLNESKAPIEVAKSVVEPTKPVEMVVKPVETVEKPLSFSENTEGVEEKVVASKSKTVAKSVTKSVEKKEPIKVETRSSRRSKIAIQAEEENLRLVRVTIDIPEDLHEKMKIKMILTKQTMKDYLLDFIRKDVGNANFGYK